MRYVHGKPAWETIRSGFVDSQDYRTPDSRNQVLYILCIDVNNPFSSCACR